MNNKLYKNKNNFFKYGYIKTTYLNRKILSNSYSLILYFKSRYVIFLSTISTATEDLLVSFLVAVVKILDNFSINFNSQADFNLLKKIT